MGSTQIQLFVNYKKIPVTGRMPALFTSVRGIGCIRFHPRFTQRCTLAASVGLPGLVCHFAVTRESQPKTDRVQSRGCTNDERVEVLSHLG